MNCPFCGEPMEEGFLDAKTPPIWKESPTGFAFPTGTHDVVLGKALGLLRPKACLCRRCRRVIVDY